MSPKNHLLTRDQISVWYIPSVTGADTGMYFITLLYLLLVTFYTFMYWSQNTFNLTIPKVKRETFVVRAFSVRGPILWNQLLNCIKAIRDFKSFKKHLKIFYFKKKRV